MAIILTEGTSVIILVLMARNPFWLSFNTTLNRQLMQEVMKEGTAHETDALLKTAMQSI
jgi:hypothetical protein